MIKPIYIEAAVDIDLSKVVSGLHSDNIIKKGIHHACCCPFHKEKTPSFYINSLTNRYHCFGCGESGDTIEFVQKYTGKDFSEAVVYLLENYRKDIDISSIYVERSSEEEEKYRECETMYIYNKYAFEFFRQEYLADNDEALQCRRYAENTKLSDDGKVGTSGRWDKEYCTFFGLGYSPRTGNKLVQYAVKKGLRLDILEKIGLIVRKDDGADSESPSSYYDFFRGRLMIPQRDKAGRIVTFTARLLNCKKGDAKYLNTKDSAIYSKSETIFGIDVALKAAKAAGKIYLCEGAPDVMRLQSIGIANAIASLGGSWCKKQFDQLASFNPTLCFIPDSDPPKEGERLGPGYKFVMKNGRLATELGFKVNVREIPAGEGVKEDVDSFVTNEKRWSELVEKDFILWYAEHTYDETATRDEQLQCIDDICDILVLVKDEKLQKSLLADLKDRYKQPKIWQAGLTDSAHRLQDKKREKAQKTSGDDLLKYRFYRADKHYYGIDGQGHEQQWTNFILKPLFLISNNEKPSRIFELENEEGEKVTVELRQADVTNLNQFKEKIEGKGNYRFRMKAEQYEDLKAYMYDKTELAVRVNQMGWNMIAEDGFFAFSNGIVYNGKWCEVDEYGIVRLKNVNVFLPAFSKIYKQNRRSFANERRFIHNPLRRITAEEYFGKLIEVYGSNAVVGIAYYLATIFRDIIFSSTHSFPLLFVYGKKGTGKTELCISLTRLFQEDDISSLASTTLYAMGEKLAQVSNGLVYFDEYKNSLSKERIDILKGIYNSTGRNKRSNDGESREQTSVDCGVVITGQEIPTADIALFERTIFLEAMTSERTNEDTDRFHELLELRRSGVTSITVDMMKYRERFSAVWEKSWRKALHDIKDKIEYNTVSERLYNNWAVLYATVLCMESLNDSLLPFTSEEFFELSIKLLEYQASKSHSTDELALFWSTFAKARLAGEIFEKQDYKIETITKPLSVTVDRKNIKIPVPASGKRVLYIRADYCIGKVNIQSKKEGREMIPQETLLSYLMSSSEYLGKKTSPLKFSVIGKDGLPVRQPIFENGVIKRYDILYDQERPLVFDYDALCENREIDFHRSTQSFNPSEVNEDADVFSSQTANESVMQPQLEFEATEEVVPF